MSRTDAAPASEIAQLNLKMGLGYMREGSYETAKVRFDRALAASPDAPEVHNAVALFNQKLGQNVEAEKHFKIATQLSPDYSPAFLNYGVFLCQQGRPNEAEAIFLTALNNPVYERKNTVYYNAGVCMLNDGRYRKAEEYLREALRVSARYSPALIKMAELSVITEKYLPARGYLQRFQAEVPDNSKSLWLGYQIEKALGDNNAASTYALKLHNNFPDSRETVALSKMEKRQ